MNALLEFFETIQWLQPWWFLLALQPLILWLILRWLSKKSQQNFADEHLLPWVKVPSHRTLWQKVFSRDTAYFLAWIGFALALANPQIPDTKAVDSNNSNTDIMLVVDLSQSMLATDIKPSRLRRATLEAYEFLSLAKNARVGVVVYAARPHLFVPLTRDFNALRFYLKDLDSLQLPTLGSDPANALSLAQAELAKSGGSNKNIIWMTDADLDDELLNNANKIISQSSINTYVLGIASDKGAEGAEIPLPNGTWLEQDGQAVISKPSFDALHKMAENWGGVLSEVSDDESDWKKIYQQGILNNSGTESQNNKKQLKSIFQWFLFPALLLLFISLFIKNKPSFKFFAFTIALLSIITFNTAKADSFTNHLKLGVESYKTKEFYLARSQFIQSVLNAKSEKERAMALHNLGNSLFQNGDYETANKLFSDALRYNPEQTHSSKNQQLSNELFEILESRKQKALLMLRGNLSAPNKNSPLFDLPENPKRSSSTLSTKAINTTKLKLPDLPKDELNKLLEKGLAFMQVMQGSHQENAQRKKEKQEMDMAKQQLIKLGEQGSAPSNALWKRLFEIEEGFAGSLKQPEKLPGVKPW